MRKRKEFTRTVLSLVIILGVTLGVTAAGYADITGTYVDATIGPDPGSGNTTSADPGDSSAWLGGNSSTDNKWWQRLGLGATMNDTIFVSGRYDYAPMLKMTLTGLTVGQEYEIRVIWHDHATTVEMHLLAGFSPDALTQYDGCDATRTGLTSGSEIQVETLLGTAIADGSGEITVYIDDVKPVSPSIRDQRTRFDGLSYVLVPEPGTLSLLAVGGLVALRRRKK